MTRKQRRRALQSADAVTSPQPSPDAAPQPMIARVAERAFWPALWLGTYLVFTLFVLIDWIGQ